MLPTIKFRIILQSPSSKPKTKIKNNTILPIDMGLKVTLREQHGGVLINKLLMIIFRQTKDEIRVDKF
jgi:hypothetical protein